MVNTWIAEISPLYQEERWQEELERLPLWRKEKALRLSDPQAKAQSVAVWRLWQEVQKKEGLGEGAVFNLSHSGDYVLCAFSDRQQEEVGCDIEVVKAYLPGVAKRFFTEEECRRLEEEEKSRQDQLFFRYWVLKESFMKATRLGTRLDTRSFEIGWEQGLPKLAKKPEPFSREYTYREFFVDSPKIKAAVCSTDGEIKDKIEIYVF